MIDAQRLHTPHSFHRTLPIAAICVEIAMFCHLLAIQGQLFAEAASIHSFAARLCLLTMPLSHVLSCLWHDNKTTMPAPAHHAVLLLLAAPRHADPWRSLMEGAV